MSGNYYRVTPDPPRPETYGFRKVTQGELGSIVERLSKPTYSSRVHTVEAHKAHNYRKIHSAPPPRSPTYCSRRRLFTPNQSNIIAAVATTTATTTTYGNNENNNNLPTTPSTPDSPTHPSATITGTIDEVTDIDNNENDDDNSDDDVKIDDGDNGGEPETSAPLPPPPPPPLSPSDAMPFSDRKLTENELRRVLRRVQRPTRAYVRSRRDYVPEEDDEIMVGDDYSNFNAVGRSRRPLTATERKKAFFLLSRPTTASRAKSSVDCAFCPADKEELKANRNLNLPFRYPHAPDEKVVSADEATSIITRVSSPTKASLRGCGPPCFRANPDYESVRGQHASLPLVSGLARTPKVSQIVNRLHYGNSRKVITVVVVRNEEEEDRGGFRDEGEDQRGSRGTSEDEREMLRRATNIRQHKRRNRNQSRQTQNGHRGYHGYSTSATPITAWA